MPRRALITIAADGATAWLPLPAETGTRARPGLPAPAEVEDELILVVPAEAVATLPAPVLAGSRNQRRRAVLYAVEEQLAAPVESLHVALSGDERTIAVVSRRQLQDWLSMLRTAGLEPDRMVPESVLLPTPGEGVSLWIDRDRYLLRTADTVLVCAPGQLAGHLALSGQGVLRRVEVSAGSERLYGEAAAAGIDASAAQSIADPVALLAGRAQDTAVLDLLQGEHAPHRRRRNLQRRWRLAAALAAAALIGLCAHALVERWMLLHRLEAQHAQMSQLYRQVVPAAGQVPDPAAALRSRLSALAPGARADALALLAQVAPVVAASGTYILDAVEVRGDGAELTLRAGDVAALDALRRQLDALPGLSAELTAATPGVNGAEGRVRVRRAGAA
ncbi:MAG TPA: type II secretion system protein GspL [Xanthomonadaceae bacterium]|nr:type II secretion system protein GspL [Xanthomonadaceae bacterium]